MVKYEKKNLETALQQVFKKKQFRGLNIAKLASETNYMISENPANLKPHKVPVNGVVFTAYDSKILNKYFNSENRGNWRTLYDGNSIAYATHNKDGSYKIQYQ